METTLSRDGANEELLVGNTNNTNTPLRQAAFGGDFAGLVASFDATTGRLIEIPHYLIPESLIEWGQAPTALEVLVSEDSSAAQSRIGEEQKQQELLRRQITTVFPATGCAVDNLETMKQTEKFDGNSWKSWSNKASGGGVLLSMLGCSSSKPFRLEVSFGLDSLTNADNTRSSGSNHKDPAAYRSRIAVEFDPTNNKNIPQPKTVKLYVERQISATSTQGTVADGGGLDGQSVAQWMGPSLSTQRMQRFAEQDCSLYQWNKKTTTMNDDDKTTAAVVLNLPRNTTFASRTINANGKTGEEQEQLELEVGQVYPEMGVRCVLRHVLQVDDGTVVCLSRKAWVEQGEWVRCRD